MSRIGKKPIAIPAGVKVDFEDGSVVKVTGPKGSLSQKLEGDIFAEIEGTDLVVKRPTEQKRHKAMHGLYRALLNNNIIGVSEGFKTNLEIVGVGYKASNNGNVLELSLGFSHNVFVVIPSEIKVSTSMEKGQNPKVFLEGIDKQLIGAVAAKIRSLRKVEPYKGKGVRFVGENVRRKAGKTGGKK